MYFTAFFPVCIEENQNFVHSFLRQWGKADILRERKDVDVMELRHVLGNTWVAEANTALLPVYRLNEREIVLIDTGYAKLDRSGLTAMIENHGFLLRGIICSHAHFDHSGNVRYLQQRYGAKAAAHIIEAGISVNPDAYRANYVALTYGKSREYFLEECFLADTIIGPEDTWLDFCGARFGILPLPGHSAGHIGVVTPDNVAYVGDCLIDRQQIDAAKLPTSMFIARDLQSKAFLRQTAYDAYIIAHKAVVTDREELAALVDANTAFIHRKAEELLADLTDGMTFAQWIAAFCRRENIRTKNEFKFSIVERNFANFVDWLTDEGRVTVQREYCAKMYYLGRESEEGHDAPSVR